MTESVASMEDFKMTLSIVFFLIMTVLTSGANSQIIPRNQKPLLNTTSAYEYECSFVNEDKARYGMSIVEASTCFEFLNMVNLTADNEKTVNKITFKDEPSHFCKFEAKGNSSEFVFFIGGCRTPGEIAMVFFSLLGLQPHETREDRDSYIRFRGRPEDFPLIKQLPNYNTYGSYDIHSIMHTKARTHNYDILGKRHEMFDKRMFPDKTQYLIMVNRSMGQRISPAPVDFIQINSEWCGDKCKKPRQNCGYGGYRNGNDGCESCKCSEYRDGKECDRMPWGLPTTLTPKDSKKDVAVSTQRHGRSRVIKVEGARCLNRSDVLGIRFQFDTGTNLEMVNDACGDYVSITSEEMDAFPEEIRLCGRISHPLDDFAIATTEHIFVKLVTHEYPTTKDLYITFAVEGVCINLETQDLNKIVPRWYKNVIVSSPKSILTELPKKETSVLGIKAEIMKDIKAQLQTNSAISFSLFKRTSFSLLNCLLVIVLSMTK